MQTTRLDKMHLCTMRTVITAVTEYPYELFKLSAFVPVLTVHQRDADVRCTWCCRYILDHVFSYWQEGD